MKRSALLILNGNPPSRPLLQRLWEPSTLCVCADGAADHLLAYDLIPDFVVGDLDSLSLTSKTRLGNERLIQLADQDQHDGLKAFEFCLQQGCDQIHLLGADGGRLDHFFANLELMARFSESVVVMMWTDLERIEVVQGEWQRHLKIGTRLSLSPLLGNAVGVSTEGLKFALNNATLKAGHRPIAVSNVVQGTPVVVHVRQGRLLLTLQHDQSMQCSSSQLLR